MLLLNRIIGETIIIDGGIKIIVMDIQNGQVGLAQGIQAQSIGAWVLMNVKKHNKRINADRFYTPRRFTLLCVKPSGYAKR